MTRVSTNNVGFQYAVETTPGVLPGSPTWFVTEPNDITAAGAKLTRVARQPISKLRQARKGAIVNLESSVEYECDVTMSAVYDVVEGFVFAESVNVDLAFRAAPVLTTGYTIPAATADQAAKIQFSGTVATLIYARGYSTAANNGLKVLTADTAAAGVLLAAGGQGLVVEASPPTNARVEVAGIRPAAADLSIVVTGTTAVLTSAASINFTTIGVKVGQFVHVGGLLAANQFSAAVGFARITAITATTLTLDKLLGTFATDTGAGETVDLLFGQFIRNVATDADAYDTRYLERTVQYELFYPDLLTGPADGFKYPEGNYFNTLGINLPLNNKATMSVGLLGLNTPAITGTRKTNASAGVLPVMTAAFGTASDIARLTTRIGATTPTVCFQSLTLNLNNNASRENCLGTLGATYVNVGIFGVQLQGQVVFTSEDIPNAVRNNTTVSLDFVLHNQDGTIVLDLPSMELDGGDEEFPLNQSVKVNFTGNAFADATLNTSIGISLFPVTP